MARGKARDRDGAAGTERLAAGVEAAGAPSPRLLRALSGLLQEPGMRPAPLSFERMHSASGMNLAPAPVPVPGGAGEWGCACLVRDCPGLLCRRAGRLDGMMADVALAGRGGKPRAVQFLKALAAGARRQEDVPEPGSRLPVARDQAGEPASRGARACGKKASQGRTMPFEAAERR